MLDNHINNIVTDFTGTAGSYVTVTSTAAETQLPLNHNKTTAESGAAQPVSLNLLVLIITTISTVTIINYIITY